jgi:hypothetical protein
MHGRHLSLLGVARLFVVVEQLRRIDAPRHALLNLPMWP